MKSGYYWVVFKDDKRQEATVGYFDAAAPNYPWQVLGSDDIFESYQFEVLAPIEPPPGVNAARR